MARIPTAATAKYEELLREIRFPEDTVPTDESSKIRDLDPEGNPKEREFAVIFAIVAALLIWGILIWMLLYFHSV